MAETKKQTTNESAQPKKSVQDYTYEEQVSVLENEIDNLNKRIVYLQGRLDLLKEFLANKK